ncbi:hypothetical protein CEF01_13330, partial [Lactobacillus crispatus]
LQRGAFEIAQDQRTLSRIGGEEQVVDLRGLIGLHRQCCRPAMSARGGLRIPRGRRGGLRSKAARRQKRGSGGAQPELVRDLLRSRRINRQPGADGGAGRVVDFVDQAGRQRHELTLFIDGVRRRLDIEVGENPQQC